MDLGVIQVSSYFPESQMMMLTWVYIVQWIAVYCTCEITVNYFIVETLSVLKLKVHQQPMYV